jgi:hypothetical protein
MGSTGRFRAGGSRACLTLLALLGTQQLLLPAGVLATSSTPTTSPSGSGQVLTPAERRQLWATVDVCNAPDDPPHTIGIRASMPGVSTSHEEMYVRFRLQHMESAQDRWVNLSDGADSGYVKIGEAKMARQYGWLFVLKPATGAKALTLRGVVTFQWRNGTTIVQTLSRPTTAGHKSLAGADPPDFSAASCLLS